jgi:hypothetical protein
VQALTFKERRLPKDRTSRLRLADSGEPPDRIPTIEEYAQQIAAAAPPLTDDQRHKLALIFQSARPPRAPHRSTAA